MLVPEALRVLRQTIAQLEELLRDPNVDEITARRAENALNRAKDSELKLALRLSLDEVRGANRRK